MCVTVGFLMTVVLRTPRSETGTAAIGVRRDG